MNYYLSGKQLKALASLASKDKSRRNINCLWLDRPKGMNLRLWATDGHQMSGMVFSDTFGQESESEYKPIAYCLDAISRLKAKDEILVDRDGLTFNGMPMPLHVHDVQPPDIDAVMPDYETNLESGPRFFGLGFNIVNMVSKAVVALNKDAAVRFQCGEDKLSPIRYDGQFQDLRDNWIQFYGAIMPLRINYDNWHYPKEAA